MKFDSDTIEMLKKNSRLRAFFAYLVCLELVMSNGFPMLLIWGNFKHLLCYLKNHSVECYL